MNNSRYKILIVDDNPLNNQFLEAALKEFGDIYTSINGFKAIQHVKVQVDDLIILDVMMPDINGFDFSPLIKSDDMLTDVPILFLTSMDAIEAEVEGLEPGCIYYMTKPVNITLLKLRVRNHLQLKRQIDLICEQRDNLERQNKELESALTHISRLEGIIPICMHCKSIRSADASWQSLEQYITEHSNAFFSHGICPSCLEQHYSKVGCDY